MGLSIARRPPPRGPRRTWLQGGTRVLSGESWPGPGRRQSSWMRLRHCGWHVYLQSAERGEHSEHPLRAGGEPGSPKAGSPSCRRGQAAAKPSCKDRSRALSPGNLALGRSGTGNAPASCPAAFPRPAGAPTYQTRDVPEPHQTHTASCPFPAELLRNVTAPAAKLGHERKDA